MFNLKRLAMGFTALLLTVAVASCDKDKDDGKENDGPSDTLAPAVLSTYPSAGAIGVALNTSIIARFSEAMNVATITGATFTVTGPGATPVTGVVSYDALNHVADFLPSSALAASTQFTATVSTGAEDLAGNALASPYSWAFTTGTMADTTAPTVTSVGPAHLSTGVPINQAVTATFSEQMDSTTFTTTSFTLMDGATPIPGSVSCPGTTATFTPAGNLPPSATITARVTIAVTDLASNPLAADFIWTFDTGASVANGPAAVVLGTAGNFVILAKTTVTTTGATAVDGNIGLSPGTSFTGFAETLDASGEFSTSAYVSGQLFKSTYAPPTPTTMTTAVLDMETAYDDAAGRVLPDFLNLGGGNLQGLDLAPGLYNWGTGVDIPSAVTLSGGANDVWIFQIAQDLTVGNGAIVTLSGGAQASNIFWVVAGQASFGTTSDFKGVVLCKTQIVLLNGAVLLGRALAQTQVTLDATAITGP
ncbi:MAG: DUF3494 domain-containing protein [Planctomycetes bacterium]|nr:DUF3494 domain-containing protein [Planctomycetota bacterium]